MKNDTFTFLLFLTWGITSAQNAINPLYEDVRTKISKNPTNQFLYGEKIGYWQYYHQSGKFHKSNFYIFDTVLLKMGLYDQRLLNIKVDSLLRYYNMCAEFCSYEKKLETVYNSEGILDTIIVEVDIPLEELDSVGQLISVVSDCFYQSHSPVVFDYYPTEHHANIYKVNLNMKSIYIYRKNGKIKTEKHFKKDEPFGKWKYYNEAGVLIKTETYK